MTEWTDPRYAELVKFVREQQEEAKQRTPKGEEPPRFRSFVYQLPTTD
ncbi:hypothetical protein J7I98_29970 [Streptomyces sp. ISL-98]|nr:hypothetical protein [Streptomyces sp. ISL-98]MBT2510016.1 hypothetical protein [Streptomyces sp. ISL-98]